MAEWTLEDAPELHRTDAMYFASGAVAAFCRAWHILNRGDFGLADQWLRMAASNAHDAAKHATRYRDAKRAVSELRNTLHDFEEFCRQLCQPEDGWHNTMHNAIHCHVDMLSEIDWEDDNDVCF